MENNLTSLEANIRETKTKSDIKKLRIDGFVPGVLYGDVESNLKLTVKKNALEKLLKIGNFMSTVIDVKVAGKEYKVLQINQSTYSRRFSKNIRWNKSCCLDTSKIYK